MHYSSQDDRSCTPMQVGSTCSPTNCRPGTQYPPNALNVGGIKPSAPMLSGNRANPKLFRAGGSGHCSGRMPGTTAHYPSACREQPSGQVHDGAAPLPPPHHTPRFSSCEDRHEAAHLGSPQPVVVPEPCSSSLIPSSVPAGATVTAASARPNTPANELGPGPSPESRPVGPAAGHAGKRSPPPPTTP